MDVLRYAYDQTCAEKILGSATACVISVQEQKIESETVLVLRSANLGDSGFVVVREGRIVCQSEPQQRGFNYPYQLGTHSRDYPEHADRYDFVLHENDTIVVATDGLFDNLFPQDILDHIEQHESADCDSSRSAAAQPLAERLARAAFRKSQSKEESPFSQEARKARKYYIGGKPDDITVVVCKVLPAN